MSKEGTGEQQPQDKWTETDHQKVVNMIPNSRRSKIASYGLRLGGLALSVFGGYAAKRFGWNGLEVLGAATPGAVADLYVGMLLRFERVSANSQVARAEQLEQLPVLDQIEESIYEPRHNWRSRIGAFGWAAMANATVFGSGAALAFASQEPNPWLAGAGAVASLVGFLGVGLSEVATEVMITDAAATLDSPMAMHRLLFNNGNALYPTPAGPSPDS